MENETNQQPKTEQSLIIYLRIWQIVGDKKRNIDAILPIGRSTFLARVKSGEYPAPVKISSKTTAWRKSDILNLLERFSGATSEAKGGA